MKCLNKEEQYAYDQGYSFLLGIDEAGRGPIAGPLVVAGVVFAKDYEHDEIYDSKKLSEKKRKQLFEEITRDAIYYKIMIIDETTIDSLNIYRATQSSMQQIVDDCEVCDYVLSDAMPLNEINKPYISLVKGDTKSTSIAAASILAKVTRDTIMYELDEKYPMYGFKNHKGYPTKKHIEALHTYGVLDIHRKSYKPVYTLLQKQLSLDLDMGEHNGI